MRCVDPSVFSDVSSLWVYRVTVDRTSSLMFYYLLVCGVKDLLVRGTIILSLSSQVCAYLSDYNPFM